jgi:tetratricopeptide (TPR) repeat protein
MGQTAESVRAWEADVVIPTYPAPEPDRNPMFLDKRVYQGSSGKVYPNPFTDRVSDTKVDKSYKAVFLENEFLRLMILPEIGGRIHVGQDKTNGYDFFYRQNAIKPALVGLLGPWISGGVEFNWPQHHRPSTFMPVEFRIEKHGDGSQTVWLSEHEPMNRMKGMVGICLYPGKAIVEAKVRLYNRTPFRQTFLWWANVGVHAHNQYQAFFPPDVTFVADHAKRAISRFPVAKDYYYGVDYRAGVDLTWYKNIPVPTSYMVTKSGYDFFGGYDHARKAGFVHVANRHIAPGKKLWTWGNAEFGYAWDRELTDGDGPYIELMAGVFTDNQPDFSWLQPYETKTFRQYWFPIQEIGPVKNANRLLAVSLEKGEGGWVVGVCATEAMESVRVLLTASNVAVLDLEIGVQPGKPFTQSVRISESTEETDLLLRVLGAGGRELIRYRPEKRRGEELPGPATEPCSPEEMATLEELYLTGLHLEQYRHATRLPESYWGEALRRDPGDARCNNAMGLLLLRRGQFAAAEEHFRRAIARLTVRNPNPCDGEPFYNLGLALQYQGRPEEAYAAFYKAAWNEAWKAPAHYRLATIACCRGDFDLATEHLDQSLEAGPANMKARNLKAAILRRSGGRKEAEELVAGTLKLDPLDAWARYESALLARGARMRLDPQTGMDVAYDLAEAGLWDELVLDSFLVALGPWKDHPMIFYALGQCAENLGHAESAAKYRARAAQASPDYCFPARIEDMLALESALRANPADARAHYYLGNLLYDKQRRAEAIGHWEQACRMEPAFSIPWRNLGIACFNVLNDAARAAVCYERARAANPDDARLLYEFDQLRKRTGVSPEERLGELEKHRGLVEQRDDLTVEVVTLYNQTGRSETALDLLRARRFHPWEGSEGLVSGQYVTAHVLLGRKDLEAGHAAAALEHFEAARSYPPNLGEGKHLLTEEPHLDYSSGLALASLTREDEARRRWEAAASASAATNFQTYYRALALAALGREAEAETVLEELRSFAERQMKVAVKIDYFATSLPNFMLFEDDIENRNRVECLFLRGLANQGLGRTAEACADYRLVLDLDRNHIWAQEALRSVGKEGLTLAARRRT